jgi:hypothetical protein
MSVRRRPSSPDYQAAEEYAICGLDERDGRSCDIEERGMRSRGLTGSS